MLAFKTPEKVRSAAPERPAPRERSTKNAAGELSQRLALASRAQALAGPVSDERRRYFHGSAERDAGSPEPGLRASGIPVQRKLAVGRTDDPLEHEADRVAEQVMRMPAPVTGPATGAPALQRKCATCEDEQEPPRELVQRKAHGAEASGGVEAPAVVDAVVRSPGQPLDPDARAFFEPRFGHELGDIRVHSDDAAAASARSVNAAAYTVGRDLVFGAGRYAPGTSEGRSLLAHELTHVVQQGRGGPSQPVVRRAPEDDAQPAPTPTPTPAPAASPTAATTNAPAASPTAQPSSQWKPNIPYIHFELLDFYRSLYVPAGPDFYYAYVWVDRARNQNFSNDSNPAPARDTSIWNPSGWHPTQNDLTWALVTKFYVDSAAAPLPQAFTKFETKADIKFVPDSGGPGFEDHFADNSPKYISPMPSYAFALSTTPYDFRAAHPIMEAGTLQWDAKLRMASASADPPIQFTYAAPAPPECLDEAAVKREFDRLGIRFRAPAPGEKARSLRMEIVKKGSRYVGKNTVVEPDGKSSERTFEDGDCSAIAEALALSFAILSSLTKEQFGASGADLVEITGSQQVKFKQSTSP